MSPTGNGGDQNIRVVARVRPLSSEEVGKGSGELIAAQSQSGTVHVDAGNRAGSGRGGDGGQRFEFDGAFGPSSTQKEVYEAVCGDMISSGVFKGFNATILAYGQTGSGKTYTMGTGADGNRGGSGEDDTSPPPESEGVIGRAVRDLFRVKKSLPNGSKRVKVTMSYLEIYNKRPIDLLNDDLASSKQSLKVRGSRTKGAVIPGLKRFTVKSPREVLDHMERANLRRATASTQMNAASSRSHAICTLNVTITPDLEGDEASGVEEIGEEESGEAIVGPRLASQGLRAKLTLVDLAGSECIKRTDAWGVRMKEGININQGLSVLEQVISALSKLGQRNAHGGGGSSIHIPYRDSTLTWLLQDSLGGNSRTVVIACISPAESNIKESINTLRYAKRVSTIKNSAVRNVVSCGLSASEAAALRRENQRLKLELARMESERFVSGGRGTANGGGDLSLVGREPVPSGGEVAVSPARLRARRPSLLAGVAPPEGCTQNWVQEVLEVSLRAKKWQAKFEDIARLAKEQGCVLPEEKEANFRENGIVSQLGNQDNERKAELLEARTEAANALSYIFESCSTAKCEMARTISDQESTTKNIIETALAKEQQVHEKELMKVKIGQVESTGGSPSASRRSEGRSREKGGTRDDAAEDEASSDTDDGGGDRPRAAATSPPARRSPSTCRTHMNYSELNIYDYEIKLGERGGMVGKREAGDGEHEEGDDNGSEDGNVDNDTALGGGSIKAEYKGSSDLGRVRKEEEEEEEEEEDDDEPDDRPGSVAVASATPAGQKSGRAEQFEDNDDGVEPSEGGLVHVGVRGRRMSDGGGCPLPGDANRGVGSAGGTPSSEHRGGGQSRGRGGAGDCRDHSPAINNARGEAASHGSSFGRCNDDNGSFQDLACRLGERDCMNNDYANSDVIAQRSAKSEEKVADDDDEYCDYGDDNDYDDSDMDGSNQPWAAAASSPAHSKKKEAEELEEAEKMLDDNDNYGYDDGGGDDSSEQPQTGAASWPVCRPRRSCGTKVNYSEPAIDNYRNKLEVKRGKVGKRKAVDGDHREVKEDRAEPRKDPPGEGWTPKRVEGLDRKYWHWVSPDMGIEFRKRGAACKFEELRNKYGKDEARAWKEYWKMKGNSNHYVVTPSRWYNHHALPFDPDGDTKPSLPPPPGKGWTYITMLETGRKTHHWVTPKRNIVFRRRREACEFQTILINNGYDEFQGWEEYTEIKRKSGSHRRVINSRQYDNGGNQTKKRSSSKPVGPHPSDRENRMPRPRHAVAMRRKAAGGNQKKVVNRPRAAAASPPARPSRRSRRACTKKVNYSELDIDDCGNELKAQF